MRYDRLCDYYLRVEETTKRLERTQILAELLREASPQEVEPIVRLSLGELHPPFAGIELGLADRLVVRAVAFATGASEGEVDSEFRKTGDLGLAAEALRGRRGQQALFPSELSVEGVYSGLDRVARAEGQGSQDLKVKTLADLLLSATSPSQMRYLVRAVTGKSRLGIADMTILDAAAWIVSFPAESRVRGVEDQTGEERSRYLAARAELERAYNASSDLARTTRLAREGGLHALGTIRITPGVPMRVMLAERLRTSDEVLEKLGGRCIAEYKYDGLRLQAHVRPGSVEFFSRRMERLTEQFPDVAKAIRAAFRGNDAIVEGECVAIDAAGELRSFQEVSRRRGRKHDLSRAIEETPVTLILFDLLYLNGAEFVHQPLPIRRDALSRAFREGEGVRLSRADRIDSKKTLEAFFEEAVAAGCEGILAKAVGPDSSYRSGSRGWQWIKLKRDYQSALADSLDLVVVGAFSGQGKRAGLYGALLMAAYNPEEGSFESVCKLGTGFDDAVLAELPGMLSPHRRDTPDPRVRSGIEPDVWFAPAIVAEVVGAELSLSPVHRAAFGALRTGAGLAVRFPRFTGRFRDDKEPTEATTTTELIELYKLQRKPVQESPDK